jgi:hypothetical protein
MPQLQNMVGRMSLENHIKNVFTVLRPKRGWNTIYWLVDVHGVIIPGSWKRENDWQFIVPECKEVLQWISNRSDQKLILWTSSYKTETDMLRTWLGSHGIVVDYVNENPMEEHTAYADFSRKCYFNILLDDKSGFSSETDWLFIGREIELCTNDRVINWDSEKAKKLKKSIQNQIKYFIDFESVSSPPL